MVRSGSVPGAELRWDHHSTGVRVNLDAMSPWCDARGFDGIGTPLADADAAASVAVTLLGGGGRVAGGVGGAPVGEPLVRPPGRRSRSGGGGQRARPRYTADLDPHLEMYESFQHDAL